MMGTFRRHLPFCRQILGTERVIMLKWALIFLVVGLILGGLGFGGVGGAFVGIAKILFFIAIALFIIFALLALFAGKKISDAI
jgi:uncharacterized membrane protein YtjA (UPF0391 family)